MSPPTAAPSYADSSDTSPFITREVSPKREVSFNELQYAAFFFPNTVLIVGYLVRFALIRCARCGLLGGGSNGVRTIHMHDAKSTMVPILWAMFASVIALIRPDLAWSLASPNRGHVALVFSAQLLAWLLVMRTRSEVSELDFAKHSIIVTGACLFLISGSWMLVTWVMLGGAVAAHACGPTSRLGFLWGGLSLAAFAQLALPGTRDAGWVFVLIELGLGMLVKFKFPRVFVYDAVMAGGLASGPPAGAKGRESGQMDQTNLQAAFGSLIHPPTPASSSTGTVNSLGGQSPSQPHRHLPHHHPQHHQVLGLADLAKNEHSGLSWGAPPPGAGHRRGLGSQGSTGWAFGIALSGDMLGPTPSQDSLRNDDYDETSSSDEDRGRSDEESTF